MITVRFLGLLSAHWLTGHDALCLVIGSPAQLHPGTL